MNRIRTIEEAAETSGGRREGPQSYYRKESGIIVVSARGASTHAVTLTCCEQLRRATSACPTMLLVFGGGKHTPEVIVETITGVYPQSCVVGGACAGIIVTEGSSCSGSEIGMVAFMSPEFAPRTHYVDLLAHGDLEAGHQLGRLVREQHGSNAAVLASYDSVLSFQPRRLHSAGSFCKASRPSGRAAWPRWGEDC